MKNFVFTGLILLFSVTANAQVYKWVDEHGKTQYTDRPPPPGAAREGQRLNIKTVAPANNETRKSQNPTDERLEFNKRQEQRKEEETKQLPKAEENKKKCIDAQRQVRLYTDRIIERHAINSHINSGLIGSSKPESCVSDAGAII